MNGSGLDAASTHPHAGTEWNLLQRIAFRFVFAYLVVYILPFPIPVAESIVNAAERLIKGEEPEPDIDDKPPEPSLVSKYVTEPYEKAWDEFVLWTGKKVFDVEIEYRPAGSGDTTWNYVQTFDFFAIAVGVMLLWTLAAGASRRLLGRSQFGYPFLLKWLRVFVRFYLAYFMIVYGSVKVIKLQFAYPGPDSLLHTYGESSPMHLLWTFMGASDGYTWFTGAGEVLAGLLLVTRRTTLLGSLVTFGVMVHVIALNFCYDVPVKLFSSHLALAALFLMAPEMPWLAKVFLLGRRDAPRGYEPLVQTRWLDWILFVVRSIVVIAYLFITFQSNLKASELYGRSVPETPLGGLWEVEEFTLDDAVRPPLTTDKERWQRLVIRKGVQFNRNMPRTPTIGITNMLGKPVLSAIVEVNEDEKTITLRAPGMADAKPVANFTYIEPEAGAIVLQGELRLLTDPKPKRVKVRLRHYGPDKFLLSSRGFHWISEVPYNRVGPRTEPPPKNPPPPKKKD